MLTDLQKASFGKRIIAAIFDGILLSILAVGIAALLSAAFKYDTYINEVNDSQSKYESQYNVTLDISSEEYDSLSATEKENYDTAYKAFSEDKDVLYNYNMLINLSILIMTFSILPSVIIIEFVVPLFFGNGQTLGKKIFSIAIMHTDGIKVNNVQLFTRAVLGKFAIELMIPLTMILMLYFGTIGLLGIVTVLVVLIAQIICLCATRTNSAIHDFLANTVAVDMASQKIFESPEKLLEYKKSLHAEQAKKADY